MKKILFRITGILIVLGLGYAGYRFFQQMPQRQESVATTKVRQGDVVIRAYSRGELRAVRSVTLTAPNLFGTVQVTRLAPVGSFGKEKDLIVEFDDSERRASLEETLLEVEQIDEQIKKARSDLAIRDNQDAVDLLRTRYNVRRAELEVKRNELISAIDAKKNLLTLEEQRRRLKQLESDINSRKEQGLASIAVLQENRTKSTIDVQREKQRIAQAKLLSPIEGLVAIRQNRSGFFMFGQQVPDIREGDTLQPGMPVADVLDLSELEVIAKVGELDRANLHEDQEVTIKLDAVPEKQFSGRIKSMSGTANANVFSGDPAKKFDVIFSIDMRQLLGSLGIKPGAVEKIMATAGRNARKAPPASPMSMMAMMGGQGEAGPAPGGPPALFPTPGQAGENGQGGQSGEGAGAREGRKGRGGEGRKGAAGEAKKGGEGAGPDRPGNDPLEMMKRAAAASSQFSEEDREKAELPLPPEENSQLQVLLRPGLLADVEITVEKIPNALHLPAQAIFEKNGKPIVYVRRGKRFEERQVQLVKRSESIMVLAGGVKPGEIVAMADPYARKDGKKGEKKSSGGGGPMGAMPAGGAK